MLIHSKLLTNFNKTSLFLDYYPLQLPTQARTTLHSFIGPTHTPEHISILSVSDRDLDIAITLLRHISCHVAFNMAVCLVYS